MGLINLDKIFNSHEFDTILRWLIHPAFAETKLEQDLSGIKILFKYTYTGITGVLNVNELLSTGDFTCTTSVRYTEDSGLGGTRLSAKQFLEKHGNEFERYIGQSIEEYNVNNKMSYSDGPVENVFIAFYKQGNINKLDEGSFVPFLLDVHNAMILFQNHVINDILLPYKK